jgi:hypothetical protein
MCHFVTCQPKYLAQMREKRFLYRHVQQACIQIREFIQIYNVHFFGKDVRTHKRTHARTRNTHE